MSTTDERLEEFFRTAVPIYHLLNDQWATMWWVFRGAIIRVHMNRDGVDTELVEPDTPLMDELVDAAGADAVLDGVRVERRVNS